MSHGNSMSNLKNDIGYDSELLGSDKPQAKTNSPTANVNSGNRTQSINRNQNDRNQTKRNYNHNRSNARYNNRSNYEHNDSTNYQAGGNFRNNRQRYKPEQNWKSSVSENILNEVLINDMEQFPSLNDQNDVGKISAKVSNTQAQNNQTSYPVAPNRSSVSSNFNTRQNYQNRRNGTNYNVRNNNNQYVNYNNYNNNNYQRNKKVMNYNNNHNMGNHVNNRYRMGHYKNNDNKRGGRNSYPNQGIPAHDFIHLPPLNFPQMPPPCFFHIPALFSFKHYYHHENVTSMLAPSGLYLPGESEFDKIEAKLYEDSSSSQYSMSPIERVCVQIEFYFCNFNLKSDKFLRSIMDDEGWVALSRIATFYRVRRHNLPLSEILDAVEISSRLEVKNDADILYIRRKYEPEKWTNEGYEKEIERITELQDKIKSHRPTNGPQTYTNDPAFYHRPRYEAVPISEFDFRAILARGVLPHIPPWDLKSPPPRVYPNQMNARTYHAEYNHINNFAYNTFKDPQNNHFVFEDHRRSVEHSYPQNTVDFGAHVADQNFVSIDDSPNGDTVEDAISTLNSTAYEHLKANSLAERKIDITNSPSTLELYKYWSSSLLTNFDYNEYLLFKSFAEEDSKQGLKFGADLLYLFYESFISRKIETAKDGSSTNGDLVIELWTNFQNQAVLDLCSNGNENGVKVLKNLCQKYRYYNEKLIKDTEAFIVNASRSLSPLSGQSPHSKNEIEELSNCVTSLKLEENEEKTEASNSPAQ